MYLDGSAVSLLDRHPSQSTLPHAIVDELAPSLSTFTFCLKHSPDLFPLGNDEGIVLITVSLDVG